MEQQLLKRFFSYQGLGNMVVEAIRYRDYPIIQAYAIYMALIYVFVNLFVDIFQQVLNPRLRRCFNEKKVKKLKLVLLFCYYLLPYLGLFGAL